MRAFFYVFVLHTSVQDGQTDAELFLLNKPLQLGVKIDMGTVCPKVHA